MHIETWAQGKDEMQRSIKHANLDSNLNIFVKMEAISFS